MCSGSHQVRPEQRSALRPCSMLAPMRGQHGGPTHCPHSHRSSHPDPGCALSRPTPHRDGAEDLMTTRQAVAAQLPTLEGSACHVSGQQRGPEVLRRLLVSGLGACCQQRCLPWTMRMHAPDATGHSCMGMGSSRRTCPPGHPALQHGGRLSTHPPEKQTCVKSASHEGIDT